MRLVWVPRSQWGPTRPYTEEFIAARVSDPATAKTSLQIHHTGAIDAGDVTPNRWTYDRAVAYMRRLEWVRLYDLGPLPYNANPALSEDGETVWLFEGRGILKRGAHTAGYNVSGVGIGVLGNLDRTDTPPEDLATLTEAITEIGRRLRHTEGLTRIGDNRNPKGWEVWGHRDTTTKSCPGALLYPRLADVRFVDAAGPAPLPPFTAKPGGFAIMDAVTLTRNTTPDEVRRLAAAGLFVGDPEWWIQRLSQPTLPEWERFWTAVFISSVTKPA
jgi:hypothetical protein